MTGVKQSGTQVGAFAYDGDGKRVKGVVNGVTTIYPGNYFEWTGSTTTMKKYYSAGGKLFAMREGAGASTNGLRWILSDHLGSTTRTVDAGSLSVLSDQRYRPWGEMYDNNGSSGTSIRYIGQRHEAYINLLDFNAR